MNTTRISAPWHLWVIGIILLAWNAFGGYDYVMTQQASREYLAPMSEPYGINVEDVIAYYESFPIWMEFAWATAIWSAVAGSVLLLLRSGFATYAFVLSLVAMFLAFGWQLANPMPGISDLAVGYIMTGVIFVLTFFEIWYTRRLAKQGVLR